MRNTATRLAVVVSAVGVLFTAVACSDSNDDDASLEPGTLISDRTITGAPALPSADHTVLVTYTSQTAAGARDLVSGTVAIPQGDAPDGGWPVISWAHGTVGVGDACAPSADTVHGPSHGYLGRTSAMLDRWVAAGYAVVQTDYEGLGTPGDHPYMNGDSASNTVVDIVRAARDLDPNIGTKWIAMGHSQGGHAAIYAAARGQDRAPELDLQAVVAMAPGSRTSDVVSYFQAGKGLDQAMRFLPILLLGAQGARPDLDADAMLTPEALPLLTAARTGCMDDVQAAAAEAPTGGIFNPGANLQGLHDYYTGQELESLKLTVPTMIVQGGADQLVFRAVTDKEVTALCGGGADIAYRVYDGADHRAVLERSFDDVRAYVDGVRTGEEPAGTCV